MLRLIVRTDDAGMAVNVGGSVLVQYRTFDVDLPEVEAFLGRVGNLAHRQVVGVELVPAASRKEGQQP